MTENLRLHKAMQKAAQMTRKEHIDVGIIGHILPAGGKTKLSPDGSVSPTHAMCVSPKEQLPHFSNPRF
jgi:hypothetical protein